jgi:predicted TIM-barrel fold metal-dependent hydrolase
MNRHDDPTNQREDLMNHRKGLINRREFLGTVAAAAVLPSLARQSASAYEWGSPVFDLHFHMRPQPPANLAHLDGAGVAKANLLTRGSVLEQVKLIDAAAPGRFTWFTSYDVTKPEAETALTQAIKDGAQGFGEMKFHVAADGPELRRAYALAADLRVPILVHFQEVDHFAGEGTWSTGYAKTFESILKAYPKTTFIGHADAFWANVSADYHNEAAYPSGPIVRGGLTDKWLADYPNLFGDLSANSGNNALSRDPGFTTDFLKRHQDKLFFGSDCSCTDGHGGGVSQAGNPAASRLAGKCVARETLAVLKRSTSDQIFRKIAWDNVHSLLKIPSLQSATSNLWPLPSEENFR